MATLITYYKIVDAAVEQAKEAIWLGVKQVNFLLYDSPKEKKLYCDAYSHLVRGNSNSWSDKVRKECREAYDSVDKNLLEYYS